MSEEATGLQLQLLPGNQIVPLSVDLHAPHHSQDAQGYIQHF